MSGRYLADACALIDFLLRQPGSMSPAGDLAMATGEIIVSSITVWELTRKESLGKLPPLPRVAGRVADYFAQKGFHPCLSPGPMPSAPMRCRRSTRIRWIACWSRRR